MGSRRELPDGHRVDELLVRQPAQPVNKIAAQKGQKNVPAAVKYCSDLEEVQEKDDHAEPRNLKGQKRDVAQKQGYRSETRQLWQS